jgi:hypothetical protein
MGPRNLDIVPIISGLIFFGEHKTTEQTKVLLESDVYLSYGGPVASMVPLTGHTRSSPPDATSLLKKKRKS